MRHPARPMVISFALACSVAMIVPAFAASLAQSPVSATQIEIAGGGLRQRCRMAQTPQGPQRRCRGGGYGDDRSWDGDGGRDGHAEKSDNGDSGSRGGWGGVYGGWNGGYGDR